MNRKITEIKRHLNKPVEKYECDFVREEPGHIVLRYVSDRTFASKRLGITFPPHCITIAFYWETRPYVFWGIYSPDTELLGYLVHICRDVTISNDSVDYLDMLLDIWFFPDGSHIILDEDEVEECLASGRLKADDKEYIDTSAERAIADFAKNKINLKNFAAALDIPGRHK